MTEPIVLTTQEALQAGVPQGRCLQGSGILCWSQSPQTGEVYFLLGKESGGSGGNGSRTHRNKMRGWCDFGGCSKRLDGRDAVETAAQTAAREFIEETCSMVNLQSCGSQTNSKTVQHSLEQGQFDLVVTTKANKGRRRYVCFICRVDWDPDIPTKFQNVRNVLSAMHQDACKVLQFHKQLPHCAPYYRPGMTLASLEPPALVRNVLDVRWHPEQDNLLELLMETQQEQQQPETQWHSVPVPAGDKYITRYVAWVKYRQQLIRNYLALPLEVRHHASVRVLYKYGSIYSLAVNSDFLEKTELEWWSTSSLLRDVDDGGRFNPFRPCFRSVLRLVLQHFSTTTAAQSDTANVAGE